MILYLMDEIVNQNNLLIGLNSTSDIYSSCLFVSCYVDGLDLLKKIYISCYWFEVFSFLVIYRIEFGEKWLLFN